MKIIVFGATGSVGMEIVKQALAQGYVVTALVRNPDKISSLDHPNLHIVKGDVLISKEVEKVISGHDAVICAIGDGKAGKIRGIGTKNILDAMLKTGVKRLICQTTLGMGDSYNNLNFVWKHIMFGFLLKKAFRDHELQEEYLLQTDLDYTIVRPSALTDDEGGQSYKIGFDGEFKKLTLKIARVDVAEFMLRQLKSNEYLRKAVSISN